MALIADIDTLVSRGGVFAPRWGWHDDHREADGTEAYLPALQQVRSETEGLLDILSQELNEGRAGRIVGASCLQLGLGECRASHYALLEVFDHVITLDWSECLFNNKVLPGVDIEELEARLVVSRVLAALAFYAEQKRQSTKIVVDEYEPHAGFDMLFIDADHSDFGVGRDHANFAEYVRPGGIIAFHDALCRPGFEEAVQVWKYLETLSEVNMIGDEVGVAWLRKQ